MRQPAQQRLNISVKVGGLFAFVTFENNTFQMKIESLVGEIAHFLCFPQSPCIKDYYCHS